MFRCLKMSIFRLYMKYLLTVIINYNKLRHILVTAWTPHVTHTAKPFRQIRDLMPTLPPPYPI